MTTLVAAVGLLIGAPTQDREYDPLRTWGKVKTVDSQFGYGPDKRAVPLRMYLPQGQKEKSPVLLFSHGLGGSRENNKYLGNHWAGRGYIVVVMQHAGSDEEVIRNARLGRKLAELKKTASMKSATDRFRDVKETRNHIEKLNARGEYAGRFDMQKIGMSGHSFGATTTQAVSGQTYGRLGQVYTDKRIKAATAFSPGPPKIGQGAFAEVKVPWLLMTGTEDTSLFANTTTSPRRIVFRELPKSGHFYELVLDGAKHLAFTDTRPRTLTRRNPNHHKAILAISSAFWDAYLLENASAREWLDGTGPRGILVAKDEWARK